MTHLVALRAQQPHAVEQIATALNHGRLHHAYIVIARDLVVANEFANAVAATLFCSARIEGLGACGVCSPCRKVAGGNHVDASGLRANDKGVIAIDPVRELVARLGLRAQEGVVKTVIIEGADRMNAAAQNALLKTLEEPPGPTCFLLTTNRFRSLLPTVRSRCQHIRLVAPDLQVASGALAAAGIEATLAGRLAALAGSDVEQALALNELGVAAVVERIDALLSHDVDMAEVLNTAADLAADKDRAKLALGVLEVVVRDQLAKRHGVEQSGWYGPAAQIVSTTDLAAAADQLRRLRKLGAFNLNQRMVFETTLMQLTGHLPQHRRPA